MYSAILKEKQRNLISTLKNLADEIETWIIDEFKSIGCDTGRSVLALTPEELERRTDLEIETIEDVRKY